jgi:hypothetical protein
MPQALGPTTVALAFAGLLAVTPFVVIAVINVIIARHGWTPLTQLVENYLRRYPLFAAALCGFFGALVGHVFWSHGDNPAAAPAPGQYLLMAVGLAAGAGVAGAGLLGLVSAGIAAVNSRLNAGRPRE